METETKFTNKFSEEIWETTYKHHTDNNIDDTFRRVAKAIASVEKNEELQKKWENKFYDLLKDFKITPGGRIYSNAGTEWLTSLMNCFVGPKPKYDQDSLEGIFEVLLAQAKTLKVEGGWGMNFSFIRPRGSFIHGIGVETPGAVKYMELFDKSSDIITAGSGKKSTTLKAKGKIRKGAMMGVLDVWHPDIEEFITAKSKDGNLNKFNISVNVSNEFMEKIIYVEKLKNALSPWTKYEQEHLYTELEAEIEEADKWDLIFPDTQYSKYKKEWDGNIVKWQENKYPVIIYKTISATYLWELIMKSTYERNDPGVLFCDIANKTHCWNYGKNSYISASNPCAEQMLGFGGVCNLASLNLTQFIDIENKKFDLEKIKKYIPIVVRFLDNVNDCTNAPLPEYLESIQNRRRIGLGIMGWASSLYILKIRFASDEAEKIKEELEKVITYTAIEASVDLAIEKGMFKDCEPEKHSEAFFWEQIELPKNIINKIKKHGIRNSALFSIQPTGNTSILANIVSGGLEPVFLHEYIRTSIVQNVPENILSECPKYWEGEFIETSMFKFVKEGADTILKGKDSNGIVYKIDKNRGLTKETLCEDYGVKILKDKNEWNPKADWAVTTEQLTVEEHIKDLKGWAKWLDSSCSKTVNLPNNYSFENFKNTYIDAYKSGVLKGITTYRAGTMLNVLASTETVSKENKNDSKINKTNAPKRPKELPGELHHFSLNKRRYYVAVGLLDGEPYEIFTGINHNDDGDIYIPKTIKDGFLVKHKQGEYSFRSIDNEDYFLTNGHADDTADALTRIISCALRHGSPLEFIVDQLMKTKGPMTTFSKILSRTVKKYIKEGNISGENCPTCSNKLIFTEGCKTCISCGFSACG